MVEYISAGKSILADGSSYEGGWVKGQRHGRGSISCYIVGITTAYNISTLYVFEKVEKQHFFNRSVR